MRPRQLVSRYLNEDQFLGTGGGGGGINGITVSDNGAPVATPAGITTIDFLGGFVNISDNGNPAGSTVTVEVLSNPAFPGITTERLNVVNAIAQTTLNWDADQGLTLSTTGANQTNITLFDPATYVYHGSGTRTNNGGAGTTTIGPGASTVNSGNGTACGRNTQAFGKQPCAFGNTARATDDNCSAFGFNARATVADSSAFGANSEATANSTSAFGTLAVASTVGASAFGRNARGTGSRSSAFGLDALASGANSSCYGYQSISSGLDSSATGTKCLATAQNAASGGVSSQALAVGSSAYGSNAVANGVDSCAFGQSDATGVASATFANGARTNGDRSLAVGAGAFTAEFENLVAVGPYSFCDDTNTTAVGFGARAMVSDSQSFGNTAVCNSRNGLTVGINSLVDVNCETCAAIGNGARIQTSGDPISNSFGIGHQCGIFSPDCTSCGTDSTISTDSRESCAFGRRSTVESAQCSAFGKDTLIATNARLSSTFGCNSSVRDGAAESVVYGADAVANPSAEQSCVIGYGAVAESGCSGSILVGHRTISAVPGGVAIGAGAEARAFNPSAAAPTAVDCPFSWVLHPDCIQNGAAAAATDRLRININGILYEINLTRIVGPG